MADTTYYDLPYPASTDKVSLGYQNMQDLAEQIDTILNDANVPIVGDGANVLRTDTVFGGILAGTYDALTLDDDAVTTAKILNSAVTTAKILDANVTGAKIESSVALAGNPTAATQATADDSTRIATTEFVNNVAADLVLGIVAPGTITNTMLAGGITNTKIDAAAAIAYSKLNLATSIVNADVSASAAIAYSKLNLATSIVNADISASAGIVDTKLATISTASKVSNSATTATDANTASAIVARDASGNFSAGMITANLTGTVTGSIGLGFPVTKTADFTVGASENWLIINNASSCVVTLPSAATNRTLYIKNLAAFTVVSASSNVKPIGTNTAGTAILPATAGTWCTLVSDGTNWIVMQSGPGLFS